ncbi:MAG: phosphoadenylyl-sulfate reductase [candidate division NC10 bacterium]|nr:phosphoadenylyl-sulfate reductase [candidate division NC10 bacterium]
MKDTIGDIRETVKGLRETFEGKPAEEVLRWAVQEFSPGIALASSFGAEDVVLIHMLSQIVPRTCRVFTLDTGRLPQETYDLMEAIRDRYGLSIEVYFPDAASVETMVGEHGPNLFYKSVALRKRCCYVRKVEPLQRALQGLSAWVTGLRREQAITRAFIGKVEFDEEHGLVKVNPLTDWTWEQVWEYIKAHQIPYNSLHDKGYPSIGCAPCTKAVQPGEDLRAGRWWWEGDPVKKECGLHLAGADELGLPDAANPGIRLVTSNG